MLRKNFTVLLLILTAACASNSDLDRLTRDVGDLKKSSVEFDREISLLKDKTSGVVKEDSFNALRESQSDLTMKVNDQARSIQELRGRFEESKFYTDRTFKDYSSERDMLKAQIAAMETQVRTLKDKIASLEDSVKALSQNGRQQTDGGQSPAASQDGDVDHKASGGSADDRTKAYEAAYQLFRDKKFRQSRDKFESFIRDYPQNDLTDNSQFWIGETYYSEKDYEGAILAYETLLKKYPDSDKAAPALLKQGFAFIEMGDRKTGRTILERLTERFPESKEAASAKKKLAEFDKKPGKKKP